MGRWVRCTLGMAGMSLLLSCGGGGGGEPAASANLTASASKALTDETVTLRWSSDRVTACQLSGLPVGAGGAVSTTGTLDITFPNAGARTLRLDCTGAGTSATASATVDIVAVTTYSVPTNLANLQYPASYTSATTRYSHLNLDPCVLDVDLVTYPQTWIGSRPLPAVRGAPLSPNIGRGISIKDIMLPDNPAFVLPGAPGAPNGCTGSLRAQFDRTIARLQALGADHVVMVQWHWVSERSDGSWTILPAEASFGPLPDTELAYFVTRAHAAGLKVLMTNQIQGLIAPDGSASVPPFSMEVLRKWFGAYQPFIAERAIAFERMGIDYWELGCNACMYNDNGDGSAEARALFLSEYDTALQTMRAHYSGKIWLGSTPWLFDHPEFIARLDHIATGIWLDSTPTSTDMARLDVDLLRARMTNAAASLGYLRSFGKPLLLMLDWVQARADVFTRPGYLEETACTAAFGDLHVSPGACIQKDVVTDFSVQAIATEAMLEVAGAASLPAGSVVIGGQYWVTDPLMPQTAFPNFATSLRNKPAEGIVKAWYAR